MAKDPLKPPVPDMLFHTIPGKPVNPADFEVAGQLSDALFGSRPEVSEPKLSLKTHNKAIEAWKEATESWKKRCLRAEEKLNDMSDAATAWRELAADYAFHEKPYPPKGTPKRQEFGDRFDKIYERKVAARKNGNPELGGLG